MNCLDCAVEGRHQSAVGVCALCNAGVCLRCVRLDRRDLTTTANPGRSHNRATRRVLCPQCVLQVVAPMHTRGFAADGISPLRQAADA
jgi:hypothetical protein